EKRIAHRRVGDWRVDDHDGSRGHVAHGSEQQRRPGGGAKNRPVHSCVLRSRGHPHKAARNGPAFRGGRDWGSTKGGKDVTTRETVGIAGETDQRTKTGLSGESG